MSDTGIYELHVDIVRIPWKSEFFLNLSLRHALSPELIKKWNNW